MKHRYTYALIIIILLGITLRYWKLGQAPAGLYLDEAGQGYSAYSILKTGKDEFGMPFPAAFRSFNDFKTPVYIYLITPLIPIFGLNTFSIRLPSFIFSILTLPLLYFLIIKLASNSIKDIKFARQLAILSTFFLSISPWHILFGRTNFECNVALFLLLFAFYIFQISLKKPWLLMVSAMFFAIALPAYHSERILVPIFLIYLLTKYYKVLISPSFFRYSLIGLLIGVFMSIPTLKIVSTPGFMARVSALSIFSTQHGWGIKEWPSLYFSYFSPRQLFWLGDSGPRSSFPGLSVMYLWQLPLYVYGLYLLFKSKLPKNIKSFVILMLFTSPIPASLTRDPFSTIRSLPMVIPLSIICAIAFIKVTKNLKQVFTAFMILAISIYSILKLYSSGYLLNEYYRAPFWDYGWQQVADTIKNELDESLPIVVDNARAEPYSQLLVYMKVDPAWYQMNNFEVTNSDYYTNMSRNTTKRLGRITTKEIYWKDDEKIDQYLVGDYLSISNQQIKDHKLTLVKDIFYPDGSLAYRILKTNPDRL